jgi:hypothetical protein
MAGGGGRPGSRECLDRWIFLDIFEISSREKRLRSVIEVTGVGRKIRMKKTNEKLGLEMGDKKKPWFVELSEPT